LKEILSTFLEFTKLAERMKKGEFLIADKNYFNDVASYITTTIYKDLKSTTS
jgi:hypothetical protein